MFLRKYIKESFENKILIHVLTPNGTKRATFPYLDHSELYEQESHINNVIIRFYRSVIGGHWSSVGQ